MTRTDPTALPALRSTSLPVLTTPTSDQPRRAFVEQVMGLPVSVHVRGPLARRPEVAEAVERLFVRLRADDATFSPWKPTSEVSRIRAGRLTIEDASPPVREVAALCEEANQATDGAFSAWLPGPDGGPVFDPTGLVKGWAVERALHELAERVAPLGGHDILAIAGGDIVGHCARTDTPDWVVGLEDPLDRSRILRHLPLREGAVATSGVAARGEHIVDPASGRPVRGLLSATVVGPSLTWADVYATAVFVAGADAGAWLGRHPGYSALLVHDGGSVEAVPGSGH